MSILLGLACMVTLTTVRSHFDCVVVEPAVPYPFAFDLRHTALVMIDFQRDFLLPGGFGAQLVNKSIEENGEGLTGIVLGSEDLEATRDQLLEQGIDFGNISLGEGKDFDSGNVR